MKKIFFLAFCIILLLSARGFGATKYTYEYFDEPVSVESGLKRVDLPVSYESTIAYSVSKSGTYEVFCETNNLIIKNIDKIVAYDFSNKTVAYIDAGRSKYTLTSIYSIVAFAEMEFRNRKLLGEVSEKAGIDNPFDNVQNESLFGIYLNGVEIYREIEKRQDGNKVEYFYKGKLITKMQLTGEYFSENEKIAFNRFLLYDCNLHPWIRKDIVNFGRRPQTIEFYTGDPFEVRHVTLILRGVEENTSLPIIDYKALTFSIEDYTISEIINELQKNYSVDIHQVIAERRVEPIEQISMEVEKIRTKANSLYNRMEYFESYAKLTEWSYATKDDDYYEKQIQNNFASYFTSESFSFVDPRFKAMRFYFSTYDIKQQLSILDVLIRKTKNNAFLYILKGDTLSEQGDQIGARESFRHGLKINPFMTNAIIDLGSSYYLSYKPIEAWICFNIARNINPLDRRLERFTAIENDLEKKHPEFF